MDKGPDFDEKNIPFKVQMEKCKLKHSIIKTGAKFPMSTTKTFQNVYMFLKDITELSVISLSSPKEAIKIFIIILTDARIPM